MTEFRTKGKGNERKVYPVKKQAYGISRELAYKDVQALREKGKRARLIETNKRLDLYAPYLSELGETPVVTPPTHTKYADPAAPETYRKKDMIIQPVESPKSIPSPAMLKEDLGILNQRGKININKEDIERFFGNKASIFAKSENGILSVQSVDQARVAMIRETMETTLPDGFYSPNAYGESFSLEPDTVPAKLPWPKLDYYDNAWTLRLEGTELKRFINALDKRDVSYKLKLEGNKKQSSVIMATKHLVDHDGEPIGNAEEEVFTTVTNSNVEGPHPDRVSIPTDYTKSVLRTLLGRTEYKNPKNAVVTMKLRGDYPIEITTRRFIGNGKHVESAGLIAPRME
ncbi:MAG: hypothetical protein ACYCR8_03210 [Cuniculiplasma sp.]